MGGWADLAEYPLLRIFALLEPGELEVAGTVCSRCSRIHN